MELRDWKKRQVFSLRYSRRLVLVLLEGASLYDLGLYWCTVVTRGRRAIVAAWSRGLLLNTVLGRYAWELAAQIAPGKVQVVARAVMPDHLHLCFTIKGQLPNAVTTLSGRWLSVLEEEAHRCGVLPTG